MTIKSKNLKRIESNNGTLIPLYLNKIKKFKINRLFILHGKKGFFRGDHAHKKCTQVFVPLSGKMKIEITKKKTKNFILNSKKISFLTIPPLHWCKIHFLDKSSSLLVLCNVKFSEKEYLRNFKDFLKYIKK